jgi:hypothetical protein
MIFGITLSQLLDFADDCVIYRKIVNNYDIEKLQTNLDILGSGQLEMG